MKHNLKITIILLLMFVITQFIGLAVLQADIFHVEQVVNGTIQQVPNPHLSWIQPPELKTEVEFYNVFPSLLIAFVVAICLLFLLSKFEFKFILKGWFFFVICIALFLAIYAFEKLIPLNIDSTVAVVIPAVLALTLGFVKVFKRNFLIHNITELMVYPGIATVFVAILNFWTVIILLILISLYDIWAVWHSGIMQKMAKYQMDKLKIFSGFFIPYVSEKMREKLKKMKKKKSKNGNKKIKVNVAILGGGDVVFPIITSGVVMRTFGLVPALFVIFGATLGLGFLFFFAEKKKFYPAMPFISTGIFLGLGISYFLNFIGLF